MTDDTGKTRRKPQAFAFEPEAKGLEKKPIARTPTSFDANVIMTPDEEDPFLSGSDVPALEVATPSKKGFSFLSLFMAAFGVLLSAALGLWIDGLIRDLFSRADWLGYAAIAATALAVFAVLAMAARELVGLRRLTSVQALKAEAEVAALDRQPAHARAVVDRLVRLSVTNPATAKGRQRLAATADDIIDSKGLLDLAELELLEPADRRARQLVLAASKRVSIVTAVSPRALVDLGYVLFEATKLIRAVAETYGTHPGKLGMLRLFRDVIAHLAVTGSIAIGDGIVQQLLGHGLASKVSARLGEGVVNGLMTARIGIAAMDLLRPLPFKAVKRPGISDFIGDLTGTSSNSQ
ncbi:TIGR01620 family protein [Rhizobium sp. KVB221]|uniref:TIGR01620 family protein n=1 Tax=Rhizobium setariae TaxID=2801340 RepID=A0A937CRQ4_9HYPH|nr:TIGR01620 family protein [Rhizobium setariae]MBL0375037.1 TIGR01620 family protein [Rhizobium setariae]